MLVGGTPAIEQDSVDALLDRLPLMVVSVILLTTLLMFLTFGSLVLPIKAALMSALGLGSTLGILTWIFIDGHGSGLLNFTPGPIMSPVLVLIIAIVYGLSTDYEVFLLSRMVEARAQGASTTESIRIGTAHTGRIITAAALILIVVTGAFGLSDLVMMKYISYGMISALIIDATLIRMFLVPATMKLLGDDCWWAPAWMKRIQQKIGLGEPILDNELVLANVPQIAPVGAIAGPGQPRKIEAASRVMPPPAPAAQPESGPRVPDPLTEPIPLSEMAIKAPNTELPPRRSRHRDVVSISGVQPAPPPEPDRGTGTQSLVPAATECQRQAQKPPHARCAGRASHRELVVGPAGPGTDSPRPHVHCRWSGRLRGQTVRRPTVLPAAVQAPTARAGTAPQTVLPTALQQTVQPRPRWRRPPQSPPPPTAPERRNGGFSRIRLRLPTSPESRTPPLTATTTPPAGTGLTTQAPSA